MNTCRSLSSGTPADASWRATPLPQSTTYGVSFTRMTWAAAELSLRGRGPPPVPRRITRVLADCADAECGHSVAATAAAPAARTLRRSMRLPALMSVIDSERVTAIRRTMGPIGGVEVSAPGFRAEPHQDDHQRSRSGNARGHRRRQRQAAILKEADQRRRERAESGANVVGEAGTDRARHGRKPLRQVAWHDAEISGAEKSH